MVDFFVVDIFCIFIYKSHKENSKCSVVYLESAVRKRNNKVNSVVDESRLFSFLFLTAKQRSIIGQVRASLVW